MFKYLNIINEPYKRIRDIDVHNIIDKNYDAYLEFIENKLRDIAYGKVDIIMPPKTVFDDNGNGGDFRMMPCIFKNNDNNNNINKVVKSVKIVGTNVTNKVIKDQICVGKAFLIHPEDNFITHIFDACILSAVRTAACAIIASKLLKPDANSILIVGSGRIGYYSCLFARHIGIKDIYVNDINMEKAYELGKFLKVNASDKIINTDVLLIATTSRTVVFNEETDHGLVISLGADIDYQTELGSSVSKRKIVVDVLDSTKFGDLKKWIEKDMINKKDIIEIFDIIRSQKNEKNNNILFVSTGTALFDNITMEFIKDYF